MWYADITITITITEILNYYYYYYYTGAPITITITITITYTFYKIMIKMKDIVSCFTIYNKLFFICSSITISLEGELLVANI